MGRGLGAWGTQHPLASPVPPPGLAERALPQLSSFIRCPCSFRTGKIKAYAVMTCLTLSVSWVCKTAVIPDFKEINSIGCAPHVCVSSSPPSQPGLLCFPHFIVRCSQQGLSDSQVPRRGCTNSIISGRSSSP